MNENTKKRTKDEKIGYIVLGATLVTGALIGAKLDRMYVNKLLGLAFYNMAATGKTIEAPMEALGGVYVMSVVPKK